MLLQETNLSTAFAAGDCDTLMSAFHVSTYLDKISDKEKEQDSNIMVGAIDSFSEQNFDLFQEKDSFENAYSCDDLMQVIRQFNENANPQSFKELTEASDVESAKERIFQD